MATAVLYCFVASFCCFAVGKEASNLLLVNTIVGGSAEKVKIQLNRHPSIQSLTLTSSLASNNLYIVKPTHPRFHPLAIALPSNTSQQTLQPNQHVFPNMDDANHLVGISSIHPTIHFQSCSKVWKKTTSNCGLYCFY